MYTIQKVRLLLTRLAKKGGAEAFDLGNQIVKAYEIAVASLADAEALPYIFTYERNATAEELRLHFSLSWLVERAYEEADRAKNELEAVLMEADNLVHPFEF
jgi:hypothetical protein